MMRGRADTIFAVSSGAGRAAVAVLRLSGPQAGTIVAQLAGACPPPRQAALRWLRDAVGERLDQALVLWFPAPASYTGEDCAELQVHGSPAVLQGVAEALVAAGARPAEAGEFTRRAVLAGKMDLLAAEAVADLVDAETRAQQRQAVRQLQGGLGARYRGWAAQLTRLLAWQEALIDFPDEDLPADVADRVAGDLQALAGELAAHLDDGRRGERLRDGLVFAIVGAPNVGKSTLLNALAGREAAIVSPQPGTTRDVLEVRVVLGGVPVTLLDTAGLREGAEAIEAEGIRRARARAAEADAVILVHAGAATAVVPDGVVATVSVRNKADVPDSAAAEGLPVSALTGAGMAALRAQLAELAQALTAQTGPPPLTRARHRAALTAAHRHINAARQAALPELRGEDLRAALYELGRVTGQTGVDDVLDAIFSSFCIGK